MRRVVGVVGVVGAIVALTGCAGPIELEQWSGLLCLPADAADASGTVGVAEVTALTDLSITDVILVDPENIEVAGWYVATSPEHFIGSALGFDLPTGEWLSLQEGESANVAVGLTLTDAARAGRVGSVRLELDGVMLTEPTGPEVTLVPAGDECS